MKALIICCSLLLTSTLTYCQDKKILIEVRDNKGNPIAEADVYEKDVLKYRTDVTGNAWLNFEPTNAKRFFRVKRIGYQTVSGINLNPNNNKDTVTIRVVLLTR